MEDDKSTNDAADAVIETPEADPVLAILTDTEDESKDAVVETEVAKPVEEAPPEGEPSVEKTEEVEATVDPKEEARRRYEERQAVIAEREARIREQSKEYTEAAEDEYDQRLRAMEVQQYSTLIQNNENTLINEFERVKANPDLQIFNPDNKEMFDDRAYSKAIKDFNAGYISYDNNGNMVGIKGSLFEHLTETAELLQGAVKRGAVQQVRDAKAMRTNADSKPAAPPKETTRDPVLEILLADD